MRNIGLFLSLVTLAGAVPAAAQDTSAEWMQNCRRNGGSNRQVHCEVRESRVAAGSTVRVQAENGGVTVRPHEGRDVVVRARIQTHASSQAVAQELARGVRVQTDGTIRATGPRGNGRGTGWSVGYEILVPARSNLDVQSENGPVAVERVAGNIQVRSANGPVNLRDLGGTVRARAQNGPITVTLAGRRWEGTGLDVETVNGPVSIRMPQGYAAHLEARTVNGPLDVPGRIQRPQDRRRWTPGGSVSTDVNGGGPTIRAATTNGPLSIRDI